MKSSFSHIWRHGRSAVSLGLGRKQWLASAMISAMLLPVFSLPVSAFTPAPAPDNIGNFEPVNETVPIWTEAWRNANAKIEEFTTPRRPGNAEFIESLRNDEKKKADADAKSIPIVAKTNDYKTKAPSAVPDEGPAAGGEILEPEIETAPEIEAKTLTATGPEMAANPAPISAASASTAPPFTDEDEFRSSFTAENNLGSPSGQVEAQAPNSAAAVNVVERAGSANFNFGMPVASLPGRKMDAQISLAYNSRVWNHWQSPVSTNSLYRYNLDGDWLAPGFKLSLGNVRYYNYDNAALTSPDGTRHQLSYLSGDDNARTYESSDGTFIRLYITSTGGAVNNTAVVKYPDGASSTYTSFGTAGHTSFFPTKIVDRNGNTVNIAYKSGENSGRILYIRDTLNRYINFHYDANNRLVTVTVPGFDGGSERQVVRFYYETMNFDTTTERFQDVDHSIPATAVVLKYLYFPGTNTGYEYDYSAAWGMIYKISDLRGMQVSSSASTDTGSVTSEGQTAATTEYNYPLTLGTPLTDVPKYTTRTDDWAGRATPSAPVTTYDVTEDTLNSRNISKITSPDGTITETWTRMAEGGWDDGLVTDTFIKTLISGQTYKTWAHTKLFWENQAGALERQNPRIAKTEQTNDANQTRATTFGHDSYNNQTLIKEHDFAAPGTLGTELRKTEMTYETGAGWINNRIVSLPNLIKTTVNSTVVSKSVIEYDNNGGGASSYLTARTDIDTQTHDARYNWSNGSYDYTTDYRGNPTKITSFADATLTSDSNAAITTMKYDIAGNMVETGANCCKRKTWTFSKTHEYAYPTVEERGDQGQLDTSATYDVNSGLIKTSSDENGQTTSYLYETDTLRPTKTTYANGGYVETFYSDNEQSAPNLVPSYIRTKTTLESNKFAENATYFDGSGAAMRTATLTPDNWLISATEYDNMGRAKKSYNPFYGTYPNSAVPGGMKYTEVTAFDGVSRSTELTLQDNTKIYSYPNEATVTYTPPNGISVTGTATRVKDQANKERRQIVDALGRVRRVDEPDANGSLGTVSSPAQPTHYEYDGNDNLSKVIQSDGTTTQDRRFKYDSLSRLVAEKQVEANATLDINGTKGSIDPANKFTKVLKYSTESLLTDGYDARGVRTQFVYDGLNRVSSVTYSGETGYQTPGVTYTYDQARSGHYNTSTLTRVATASVGDTPATATEFDYDLMGRVVKHRQSIDAQTYPLEYGYNLAGQLTSEKYPSGKIVTNAYDANGRLASVADGSRTYVNNLLYQGNGGALSSMTLGNGTTQTFTLNDRLQMSQQQLKRGTEVLQKYDYGFGQIDGSGNLDTTKNNGQLARVESWIGAAKQWTQKFSYDSIGRLSQSAEYRGDDSSLTYKQTFDFDRFGNMYRKTASNPTTGQANPLPYNPIEDADISKSSNRFTTNTTYDDAGNVVTDNKFRAMGFSYDANGRMVKATKTSTPDALSVYDASGMRVAEHVNDVWRFLIYDIGGKLVAEYGGLQSTDEGGVKYLLQDWQGSTRAVVGNSGYVQGRMDFTAFGEDIGSGTGLRTTVQGFGNVNSPRQKYGLTERDDSTGMDHTWFRKHENRAGRWTSPDPYNGSMGLGNPQSFNRYSYVGNDPTNFVDPSGLDDEIIRIHTWTWGWDGQFLRFWLDSRSQQSRAAGNQGGSGRGGGGRRGRNGPQPLADPCAGKKGRLDHSSSLTHITERHIEQTPAFRGKKSYYTFGLGFTRGSYTGSTIGKQTSIMNINQDAFENGGAISLSGGGIAYVFAPYFKAEAGANGVAGEVVGADASQDFKYTNARTVIVKPDCKTVETSYPGLPAGVRSDDPRIVGQPTWWSGINIRL